MFLVDWFSFTSKVDSLSSILEMLGITNFTFENINGFYGYQDSLYFNGIRIHYNGRTEDMGILVEISGIGCRTFETYSKLKFFDVFKFICENEIDYNITRLDVAFDDKSGIIPIKQLEADTRKGNFVSKFRKWGIEETSDGDTVYQGSQKSDIMLRIYDKAAERNLDNEHWIRCELQLRNERSYEFLKKYVQTEDIGSLFCGVLYNYIRYVIPDSNTRLDRCKLRKYWKKLIDNCEKVKLFTPCNLDYNLENLHHFVVSQAGGAVNTYLNILGYERLKEELDNRKTPLNPKYKRLLSEFNKIGDIFD